MCWVRCPPVDTEGNECPLVQNKSALWSGISEDDFLLIKKQALGDGGGGSTH